MREHHFTLALSRIASFVLRLVCVPKCIVCGEVLEKEGEICPDCLAIWKEARGVRCPKCHKTAVACSCRPRSMFSTDPIRKRPMLSLIFLGRPGSKEIEDKLTRIIVYKTKRSEDRSAANFCARELSLSTLRFLYQSGENPRDWILTYPPGAAQRIRKYGFDQSRQLTKKISKYTGIPWISCFKRTGHTMQKTLNSMERCINAEKSYTLHGYDPAGKRFLLIDDVITTGATINACARLLQEAGAENVFPISIARTKRISGAVRRTPASRPWFMCHTKK